ncbi:hypothetical protein [uncultured Cyclobacterium sp.]|uniref:YkgJ family cysteine cluster protein n=1 Tax=uncultured Cyclobacterium sp. TaxID=453820 RepID=UPI0030ED8786|tara:strand:+ start:106890 stop:107393 length:504 start_codon:yes stop_codon:yes gene_type:complete
MSDSSNICLSCGICCDGTLIGFVQLDPEEVPRVKAFMEIEDEKGNGFFLQPCKKFCDACTVYSKRPSQCASFECGLLKSVDQKELEFDSAVEMVKVVKIKKVAIEEKLALSNIKLQSQSFYFKMVELNRLLRNKIADLSISQSQQELLSDIEELDNLVMKNFDVSFF